jgi:hypothetical protein
VRSEDRPLRGPCGRLGFALVNRTERRKAFAQGACHLDGGGDARSRRPGSACWFTASPAASRWAALFLFATLVTLGAGAVTFFIKGVR